MGGGGGIGGLIGGVIGGVAGAIATVFGKDIGKGSAQPAAAKPAAAQPAAVGQAIASPGGASPGVASTADPARPVESPAMRMERVQAARVQQQAQGGGSSGVSTMLTGPQGVDPQQMSLGRNTLLGG